MRTGTIRRLYASIMRVFGHRCKLPCPRARNYWTCPPCGQRWETGRANPTKDDSVAWFPTDDRGPAGIGSMSVRRAGSGVPLS